MEEPILNHQTQSFIARAVILNNLRTRFPEVSFTCELFREDRTSLVNVCVRFTSKTEQPCRIDFTLEPVTVERMQYWQPPDDVVAKMMLLT